MRSKCGQASREKRSVCSGHSHKLRERASLPVCCIVPTIAGCLHSPSRCFCLFIFQCVCLRVDALICIKSARQTFGFWSFLAWGARARLEHHGPKRMSNGTIGGPALEAAWNGSNKTIWSPSTAWMPHHRHGTFCKDTFLLSSCRYWRCWLLTSSKKKPESVQTLRFEIKAKIIGQSKFISNPHKRSV